LFFQVTSVFESIGLDGYFAFAIFALTPNPSPRGRGGCWWYIGPASSYPIEKVILSPSPSGRGVGVRANEPSAAVPSKPNQIAVKRRYSINEPPEFLVFSGNGCF
jgi:hypothetical protein